MAVKTRKFSEFDPVEVVDEPVGLNDGANTIGESGQSGAPSDATYIVQTADPDLPNAQALDQLPAGIMITDGNGVVDTTGIVGDGVNITVTGGTGPGDPYVITFTGGGGGVDGTSAIINQPGHPFTGGEWVRIVEAPVLAPEYQSALANVEQNAERIGVVTQIIDANNFVLKQSGRIADFNAINPGNIPYLPLTVGGRYFLSATQSGRISETDPSTADSVSLPCFIADTTNSGWIVPYRGLLNASDSGSGGAAPDNPSVHTFTQVGHGFAAGDLVTIYLDMGVGKFKKADNRNFADSQVVGMVIQINVDGDPNKFRVQIDGWIDILAGKLIGQLYYLGENGQMTEIRPTGSNTYIKPVYLGYTDGSGFLFNQLSLPQPTVDGGNIRLVQQANAFWIGAVIRQSTGAATYTLAQANNIVNATTAGIVVWRDANAFIVQQSGFTNALTEYAPTFALSAGTRYWLSATDPGYMTPVEPTANGEVSKLMFISETTTTGQIQEQRPMLQPNANGGGGGGGGGGSVVQTLLFSTTGSSSSSAPFTGGGTALITQGAEIINGTINVTDSANIVAVSISGFLTSSPGTPGAVACFRNDTSACIGVFNNNVSGGVVKFTSGTIYFSPGVAGNLTISARVGPVRLANLVVTNSGGLNASLPSYFVLKLEEITP